MRTLQILQSLFGIRKNNPAQVSTVPVIDSLSGKQLMDKNGKGIVKNIPVFESRKVEHNGKDYFLLKRSAPAMFGDQKGALIFADQNPFGKSNWACQIQRGERLTSSVQWLYFKPEQNDQPIAWLGNVVDGEFHVLVDVMLDPATKIMTKFVEPAPAQATAAPSTPAPETKPAASKKSRSKKSK